MNSPYKYKLDALEENEREGITIDRYGADRVWGHLVEVGEEGCTICNEIKPDEGPKEFTFIAYEDIRGIKWQGV